MRELCYNFWPVQKMSKKILTDRPKSELDSGIFGDPKFWTPIYTSTVRGRLMAGGGRRVVPGRPPPVSRMSNVQRPAPPASVGLCLPLRVSLFSQRYIACRPGCSRLWARSECQTRADRVISDTLARPVRVIREMGTALLPRQKPTNYVVKIRRLCFMGITNNYCC